MTFQEVLKLDVFNKENEDEGKFEPIKLRHLRNRCILESIPTDDSTEGLKKNGEDLMSRFLEDKDETAIRKLFALKNNAQIDKQFYDFLSREVIPGRDEKKYCEEWGKRAKLFITRLANYRVNLESKQQSTIIDNLSKMNNDPLRYIYELIQNADDCEYDENPPSVAVELSEKCITISYNEKGMTPSDIIAITSVHESNKIIKKKKKKIIGEKGIGFKTIFSVCDSVDIHSGYYHFRLSNTSFVPEWINDRPEGMAEKGTTMILNIKSCQTERNDGRPWFSAVFYDLLEKYGVSQNDYNRGEINKNNIFKNCPIMFTNNISKLTINNRSNGDCLEIFRNINDSNHRIIRYRWSKNGNIQNETVLNCFAIKKGVRFTYEEYRSHYSDVFSEDEYNLADNSDVIKYELYAVVPEDPQNDGITSGGVYTYMPTYMQTRAPISFQIPFELNADRSAMWMQEGSETRDPAFMADDMKSTKWNKRLFDETFITRPGEPCLVEILFGKLREEHSQGNDRMLVADYAPRYENEEHDFFFNNENGDEKCLRSMNKYCIRENENCIYALFRNIPMFTLLNNEGWVSADSDSIMYDSFTSGILSDSLKSSNVLNDEEARKLIAFYDLDLENKHSKLHFLNININKYCTGDEKKRIEFANRLIGLARARVIELLSSENKSDYFPKDKLGEFRLIRQDNGFAAYSERKVWFVPDKDYSIDKTETVGLWTLRDDDTEKKLLALFENSGCIIYDLNYAFEARNKSEKQTLWDKFPEYGFEVFVQAMSFLAQKDGFSGDWFEFTKSLITPDKPAGDDNDEAEGCVEEGKKVLARNIIALMAKEKYQKKIFGGETIG